MTAALPRRISVVVPTRDRPEFLRQALASIRSFEGNDYSFEILVGDNGALSETRAVADEFGAKYLKVTTAGAGAARNAGLSAATGDYIAFLDDDDVWLPTHLKQHFEILDAEPDVEAVIGQVIHTDYNLKPLWGPHPDDVATSGDELLRRMLGGYFPQIGTTVARAGIRSKIGLFDETLIGGQDLDWLLRIARRRTLRLALTPCVLFRGRPSGSFDALQMRRVGFDRKVFLRHSIPEWRIWKSPAAYESAYRNTLTHFFQYFTEAAVTRAKIGDRAGARRAIRGAFIVFPLRTAYHLIAPRDLRRAFFATLPLRKGLDASQS